MSDYTHIYILVFISLIASFSLETFPGAYLLVLAGLVIITIPVNIVQKRLLKGISSDA